jgi:hypothetical protein
MDKQIQFRLLFSSSSLEDRGPVPVAAQSKKWVYGRSPAGFMGSYPSGGMNVWLL